MRFPGETGSTLPDPNSPVRQLAVEHRQRRLGELGIVDVAV